MASKHRYRSYAVYSWRKKHIANCDHHDTPAGIIEDLLEYIAYSETRYPDDPVMSAFVLDSGSSRVWEWERSRDAQSPGMIDARASWNRKRAKWAREEAQSEVQP